MSDLRMLSAYSDYVSTSSSVYSSLQVSNVQKTTEPADVENPVSDLSVTGAINDEAIISDKARAMLAMEKSGAESGLSNNTSSKNESTVKDSKSSEDSQVDKKKTLAQS